MAASQETTWFGSRRHGQPTFYYINASRLIGRLMHLFYGLRFSRQVDGKFVTIWYPPTAPSARFDDPPSYLLENIFDLDKYRSDVNDDLVVFSGIRRREAAWTDLGGPEFAHLQPDNFERDYFVDKGVETYGRRFPFYQFSDEKKRKPVILAEVSELFRSMPHVPAVQEALKKAQDKIGTDTFTAIHVRRSDVCDWLQTALLEFPAGGVTADRFRYVVDNFVVRVAPPESYFPEVAEAIAAKRKIVFTADVPDAIIPFEKYFGAEHFVDLATLITAAYPIQKAFCDFCILTMANKVVSTGSMFARTATIFGNSRLSNVALCSSVEELEKFAIDLLVPQFAGEQVMRNALLLEMGKSYAARKVTVDGRKASIAAAKIDKASPTLPAPQSPASA